MFFFNRSISFENSGLLSGYTDWHSHILPGVDDGVETMEEALQILKHYEQLGVKHLYLTPHIMEDIPNETRVLKERFAELVDAYSRQNTEKRMSLTLASENMIDTLFVERLEQGDFLTLDSNKKILLVETSYYNPPIGFQETLKRVQSKGYNIVLAHPERYHYMGDKEYELLHGMNVEFQLNLMSLLGTYDKDVRSKARKLLSKGWYQRTGSDLHSENSLDVLLKGKLIENEITVLRTIM